MNIEFMTGGEKVLFRSSEYSGYELCWLRTQKGEQTWTPEKYFATIEQGLQRVMELKIRADEVSTLAELKQSIEKARVAVVETWQVKLDTAG